MTLSDLVSAQFSKSYDFGPLSGGDILPALDRWFLDGNNAGQEEHARFTRLRDELNATKSRLNKLQLAKWHWHTRAQNPAGTVVAAVRSVAKAELLTQAWCKFYECLNRYPDLIAPDGKLRTAHLCEAPGAFVAALNHYLVVNSSNENDAAVDWDWRASTLNPFYEGNSTSSMINDDRFVIRTLDRWCFGPDDTGDILNATNRRNLADAIRDSLGQDGLDLVTADGSVDCQGDPARQESAVAPLHLSEVAVALTLLAPGGSMVLKTFTLFESCSRSLVFLLLAVFEKVSAFKPATSKEGNSEIYLICRGYRDNLSREQKESLQEKASEEHMLFCDDDIPNSVVDDIYECALKFKCIQCSVIERNLSTYESKRDSEQVEELRKMVAQEFLDRNKLHGPISRDKFITGGKGMQSVQQCLHIDERKEVGTFEDRLSTPASRELKIIKRELLGLKTRDGQFRHVEWLRSPTLSKKHMQVSFGKPISRIRSSKFCPGRVMDLCWEECQSSMIDNGHSDAERPAKRIRTASSAWDEHVAKLHSVCPELGDKMRLFAFAEPECVLDGDENREKLAADVRELTRLLKSLDRGDIVCVRNLRPVSRLRLGVLLSLSCAFEEIGFAKSRGKCNCVILSEFTGDNSQAVFFLDSLEKAIVSEGDAQGGQVLQMFSMDQCTPYRLYTVLVQYNFYMVQEWAIAHISNLESMALST